MRIEKIRLIQFSIVNQNIVVSSISVPAVIMECPHVTGPGVVVGSSVWVISNAGVAMFSVLPSSQLSFGEFAS